MLRRARKIAQPLSDAEDGRVYGLKGTPFKDVTADDLKGTMDRFRDGLRRVLAAQNGAPAPPKTRRKRKLSG